MTIREVLDDIRTPRRKKVILDCDTHNEIDDQYAVAYVLGRSDVFDVLAMTAEHFHCGENGDLALGMEKSYLEFFRVMEKCGKEGICPVYRGATTRIAEDWPLLRPVDTDASRAIIKHVHEAGEIVYIIATGAITNVTSAIMLDPTIKEKICVIWLGGNCLEHEGQIDECNLWGDYTAGQILINSGVNFIQLPANGAPGNGTKELLITQTEFEANFIGDSKAVKFFRDELPFEMHDPVTEPVYKHVIWDVAGPAVLSIPDAFEFRFMPAPIFAEDRHYAFDRTRHEIIYMDRLDRDAVLGEMYSSINGL